MVVSLNISQIKNQQYEIEVLNIETNLYKNTIFTLYNAKGKVIIEKELTSITTSLDVTKLATGGYFIVFRNQLFCT